MSSLLRKRKREDTEADDYSGGIETEVAQASSATKKHTMESDDEEDLETYNKKKYDVLHDDDIEGQEEATEEFDGETRITPFNMNDEMEDGYFDGRGMYIWNKKDSSEIKDSWLDSVDWVKIKKTQPNKDDKVESDDDTEGKVDAISLYKECLNFLTPGESFLKAIKRLGGGKQMSASERLKQKKLAKKAASSGSEQSTSQDSQEDASKATNAESVNKLTELINKIMFSTGNMDIYEETFESVTFKIQEAENAKKVCDEDIFQ